MSRGTLQTVTLPILVESGPGRADGWATVFPTPNSTRFTSLRIVKKADVWKRLQTWKRSQPEAYRLCIGVSLMQRGYESRDEAAFREAFGIVLKWVPHFGTLAIKPLRNEQAWRGTNWIYSSLMANLLQSSSLILMYTASHERPLCPGLYCPDWKTAAFAFIGTGHMRMCLKCRQLFVPKADNQEYCTPAHREAYRVARWRSRK